MFINELISFSRFIHHCQKTMIWDRAMRKKNSPDQTGSLGITSCRSMITGSESYSNYRKITLSTAGILACFVLLCSLCSCSSTAYNRMVIENGGLPNELLGLLKKSSPYVGVYHDLVYTAPYTWELSSPVNFRNPSFPAYSSFDDLIKLNNEESNRLFREISGSFNYMRNQSSYEELSRIIGKNLPELPGPVVPEKGDLLNESAIGSVYQYPPAKNAKINIREENDFTIIYDDGAIYTARPGGDFSKMTAKGEMIFSYTASNRTYTIVNGKNVFKITGKYKEVSSEKGTFGMGTDGDYLITGYTPPQSSISYYRIENIKKGKIIAYKVTGKWPFDYIYNLEYNTVTVMHDKTALILTEDCQKFFGYTVDNGRRLIATSHYLPIGLTLKNINSSEHSYGEFAPAFSDKYITKQIGPFNVFYTPNDEVYAQKLKSTRMTEVELFCRTTTGMDAPKGRAIILPSGLETYRKLHAPPGGELMKWYPGAYENNDLIVLWPPSVSIYNSDEGQEFYFNREIYETIAHEYTHVLIEEESGIVHPVPHWLHEGLAEYVETRMATRSREFWDGFADALVSEGASDYYWGQSRIFYGQSYAMVKYLIQKHGMEKVVRYIRSFKPWPGQEFKDPIIKRYKSQFSEIFGTSWEQAVKESGLSE
jgi:hypothetical protein